jgi:hypothetical protein
VTLKAGWARVWGAKPLPCTHLRASAAACGARERVSVSKAALLIALGSRCGGATLCCCTAVFTAPGASTCCLWSRCGAATLCCCTPAAFAAPRASKCCLESHGEATCWSTAFTAAGSTTACRACMPATLPLTEVSQPRIVTAPEALIDPPLVAVAPGAAQLPGCCRAEMPFAQALPAACCRWLMPRGLKPNASLVCTLRVSAIP